GRARPRPRDLLRARRDGRRRDRRDHGGLGEREQVLAARRDAGRRAADVLRAADGVRGVVGGDGGGDAVADGRGGGVALVVAAVAGGRRRGVLRRGPRRAAPPPVRHAGRRLRADLRPVHRVRRAALRAVPPVRVRGDRGAV